LQRSYFRQSSSLLYSYLICLPLLILYEVLILISQPDPSYLIRISVDAWFKSIFTTFGLNALSATFYVAAAVGLIILWRERHTIRSVKIPVFLVMLAESLFYAMVIALSISILLQSLLMQLGSGIDGLTTMQLLALSLGAGLYEELFFRVILVSLLIWLFSKIFKRVWMSSLAAILLAAICFSTVHYIGTFGDPFSINSFLFRFFFGLALNVIYLYRGFGIAAWTHALYDIMVVLFR